MTPTAAAPALSREGLPTEIHSEVLGPLILEPEQCFLFPDGILGFPACRGFALVPTERPAFFWLQSLDHPPLTFLLVDPFVAVEGYSVNLPETEIARLGIQTDSEVGVLAVVTLPRTPDAPATVNLQGVIALNFTQRIGRQVVLPDSPWGIRWPVDLREVGDEESRAPGTQAKMRGTPL